MRNPELAIGLVLVVVLIAAFLAVKGPSYFESAEPKQSSASPVYMKSPVSGPKFTGGKVCAKCHQSEYDQWLGSHHDLAMRVVDGESVLGDFGGAEFDYYGRKSRFYKQDDRFLVETDGPDGELCEYEIKYTFGVYPLQQYLVEFPGGRLQALGIAWDSRPAGEGGQLVSSLPRSGDRSHRHASLDRHRSELEPHVCRLSFYQPQEELRPRNQYL